ncbi:MAG: IS1 family transposase [Pseudomonadota bacterium]
MALSRKKTQKLWIWKVLDSVTGQLLERECGDRSAGTLKKLYERTKKWNVEFYCTDELAAYSKILLNDRLVMSKAITVSKSLEMVDLSIFLFAAYHVNKTLILPSLFT